MSKFLSLCQLGFITLFMASCAQVGQKAQSGNNGRQLTQEEVKKLNDEAIAKVSEKLKQLTIAAKASGEDKINYLSSDMFLKANSAQMEGDFQTANLIYSHLVNLVPKDNFVKKKYAVSLIRTGDLDKSEKLLEEVFTGSKGKDSQIGLILAGVYSSLGKSNKSKKIYRKLLSINKQNEDACVFLGKAYALENKFTKAVSTLKTCEKRIKKKGIFSYYIGKMYVDKGNLKLAQKYFKRSAKIEPGFGQSTMALGVIYEEQKQNSKAIATYKNYLKKYPEDTLILNRIVQLLFSSEKHGEVIPFAEKLSDYEPDNLNLKVKLGILYTDVKEYSKAISTFKMILAQVPANDKILYYLGAIYQEIEEYESAIEYFTMVTTESGLYQDSSVQVAQMLSTLAQTEVLHTKEKGRFHKQFLAFVDNKIEKLQKLKVEFSVIKAGYFENINSVDEAINSLEVISSNDSFTENHKYYLASLYEKDQEFDKASDLIFEVLEKEPENAHAWNFLGYSLIERGIDLDKAYEYLSKAVKISPNDGYIRDSLGWYYYKVGRISDALDELNKAKKLEPQDVSIQKHLAIIYTSKKDFRSAKKYIVEAIKLAKQESERKELYNVLKSLESKRVPASFK
jgi:tetratricopeptide (TPR) repeat protein